jgi:VanZ family protein
MNPLPLLLTALVLASARAPRDTPVAHGNVLEAPLVFATPSAATPRTASVAAPVVRDPWLGVDKARHLFMAFALTTMTFGAGRAAGLDARAAMPVAVGVTLAAGFGKEIHDQRRGRFFSVRDLAFDLLGLGLGLTLGSYTR